MHNPKCDPSTGECFWYSFIREYHRDEAQAECERHGGDLATIDTENKFNFVLSFLPDGYVPEEKCDMVWVKDKMLSVLYL